MKKTFAIFDMDGTLTDSMGVWNQVAEEYFSSLGFRYSAELMERTAHLTVLDSAALFVDYYKLDKSPEQVASEIDARMERRYTTDIPLKPGARAVLERMRSAGVRMCVASSTAQNLIDACLRRLEVRDFFQFLLSAEEVGAGKDRPDVYLEAVRRLGGLPRETVVFEDALHAAQTAKAAGFQVAAVCDAFSAGDQEALKKIADYYITGWDDEGLLSWLEV